MAIQPIFRADPNAVPQINGLPGVVSGAQKGYQLAQLPEQMKMEKMLKAAQLEKDQLYNKYYAPSQEADIANKQANTGYTQANTGYVNKQTDWYDRKSQDEMNRNAVLNDNTRANTSLTSTQAAGAADDLKNQRQLYAALQAAQNGQAPPQTSTPQPQTGGGYAGSGSPQPQAQPQYQPGQGGAMYAAPQQNAPSPQMQGGSAPMQGAPQQQPQAMAQPQQPQQGGDSGGRKTYVVQEGQPGLSYLDNLALNPIYSKQLAKMGVPAPKTTTTFNSTSGMMVTTTELPSGRITTTTTPVTNGSNGIVTSYDDQGRPIIKIGGSATGGRGQGGLSTDADGNLISNPTTTTQTNLQQRDIGKDVAVPYLDELANNLPQFQNIAKRGTTAAEGVLNNLGANFKAPSDKATGESAITLASEGLLKAFGLYGAHANIEEVKATLRPQWGESKKGYEKRIQNYKADTINNAIEQKKKLAGIKVNENSEQEALNKIDQNRVKHLTDNYSLEQLKAMQAGAQ